MELEARNIKEKERIFFVLALIFIRGEKKELNGTGNT